MQLPTMVKQIGKVDGRKKVYLEDYVYTYLNELKKGKGPFPVRAALFGHAFCKEEKKFYLVYGAASVIDGMEYGWSEEQVRREYFAEYELIGYVNIYGNRQELPGRKEGYYIFYDKNESMQNYLLFCYRQKGGGTMAGEDGKGMILPVSKRLHRKAVLFSLGVLIKKIIYGGCIIILIIAVSAINDYDKMYGFVEAAGRAIAMTEEEG